MPDPTVSSGEPAGDAVSNSKRGRPRGPREPKPLAEAPASRCPNCGSTERTPYRQTRSVECNANDIDGHPYNRVTFRHCECAACGQARVDRTRELVTLPA